ncbi:MAG: glycerol-3-phosphate responsive antiterminator [Oscillospiraceae bacterium]|nr:glycerol-3-phosphate responsive antiterminator [Oscillospiraceae bacterium]
MRSVQIVKLIKNLLMDAPIIAAVKDNAGLQKALESDCQVIFLLYGTILNIDSLVERVHSANKICFVHIDLVDGLSNRDIAVDGLIKLCHPDGIISTRAHQICRAQQLGLLGIQRTFMLDSISLQNLLTQIETTRPDFIEMLPGIIPSVFQEIREKTTIPLIAGGLIRRKQDVIQALQAGVIAVSTSCQDVWEM